MRIPDLLRLARAARRGDYASAQVLCDLLDGAGVPRVRFARALARLDRAATLRRFFPGFYAQTFRTVRNIFADPVFGMLPPDMPGEIHEQTWRLLAAMMSGGGGLYVWDLELSS